MSAVTRRALVAGGVTAAVFLLLNALADGFPVRCVARTSFQYTIGLPEGVTYQQWYRDKFGKNPPPPTVVVDRAAMGKNALAGVVAWRGGPNRRPR